MRRLVALLGLLLPPLAFAGPTVLSARDMGWEVRFEAPATEKLEEQSTPAAYHYLGNAGKFNLSLFIESPQCSGGASSENQIRCFLGRVEHLPGLVKQSIRMNQLPKAVQISYLQYGQVGETAVKVLHSHILFADKGKWGDLHGSIVRPDTSEIATLLALGDGFSFTD